MFESLKQKPTAAVQWFKNGDHPKDKSRNRKKVFSGSYLSEGNVVRRYIHPQVSGDNICPKCGQHVRNHGWLDQGDFSKAVCPGDWVITVAGGYRVINSDTFITLFGDIGPEEPQAVSFSDEPTIKEIEGMAQYPSPVVDKIVSEFAVSYYEIAPNVMMCALVHAGASISATGTASCLVPEKFDETAAKEHAYNDAAGKVQQFENYRRSMNKHRLGDRVRDIGYAVANTKSGSVAARKEWIGNGMYIFYVPAGSYPASRNGKGTLLGQFPDDMVPYEPYLAIKNAAGKVVPWTPSISDTLAEDWYAWDLTTNGEHHE